MPAAVVRGILLTVGIIAALGLAAYENPEIQRWLDEQRRKLAQFLRSIGDELDPQTRREAEAFAFGSAMPSTHQSTRAPTASTTGAETSNATTIRRLPVQGSTSSEEREERQRLGQEYLARRQQQMQEMRERRQSTRESVSRSTSFDSIVNEDGKLKQESDIKEEPVAEPSNPFSDAHEIDRSQTPRPPVPPKIDLEHIDPVPVPESVHSLEPESTLPGRMPGALPTAEPEELSYEEQLAIALSLSREEGARADQMTTSGAFEQDLHNAIRLSLQDHQMDAFVPDPDVSVPPSMVNTVDELYDVTPNLTRATLAQLNTQHPSLTPQTLAQDSPGPSTPARSFAEHASTNTMSEAEMIEVEDQASDIISEDGIVTPDSWTEVGSHVGDSDTEMHPTLA